MKPFIDLRKLREDRNWTQLQTAKALGFCRSYVSAVENRKQGVSTEMINAIIRVFHVRYEDFYMQTHLPTYERSVRAREAS